MGTNPDVTGRAARIFLIGVAVTMAVAAIAFEMWPPQFRWVRTSTDARALAERMAGHPTDWQAASALTEVALDTRLGNRIVLWRAAYEDASMLAPERTDPVNAFARAAFFHWTELSAKDKRDALAAFAPLLRDPTMFSRMARPLFELTGDLSMLRRSHPPTASSTGTLISLALSNGLFADYRSLRGELEKKHLDDFAARRHTATPAELIGSFPDPPYHADAEPLITALLDELHRRPLDDNPNRVAVIDAIVDYSLRHGIGPLDGLEIITRKPGAASIATRIKLARKLGLTELALQLEMASNDPRLVQPPDSAWQGLCEKDVCHNAWRTIEAEHAVALRVETVQTDNVPAYAEIYVDDTLRAEGEVGPTKDFIVPVGNRGAHRVEVVLANPLTRNRFPRRLHVASITTL
ncbi:MAG TPA: hypothetical protein VNN08_02000 [Thermoanaerobaculia bacterium]|nr:hypothetical protein [Thermoanaerobaculia bacterium]